VTSIAVGLAVLAGLSGSVQIAVMGSLGGRIGVIEALTFATVVQLVLSLTILAAARGGPGNLGNALRSPAWMWLGGVMGLTVVFSITFAQPRIGASATIGLLIAGQFVMGAVIDRFGLFGVTPVGISPTRLVGIALLGIGAALSLVRS
jgi:transporter family-2 protein